MSYPVFKGNRPGNVSKDAKYTIRHHKNGFVVALLYLADEGERWHVTTQQHPVLVELVNKVKLAAGKPPGGSFYINEYKQVIVPVVGTSDYFLAGKYAQPLRFEFETKILSGEALDLKGDMLSVGSPWVGPHPGIPYVLSAGGQDIRYRVELREGVKQEVKLSGKIGKQRAAQAAAKIAAVKGTKGGRFYVNEFGTAFGPVAEDGETDHLYIGQISLDEWFPDPQPT